MKDKEMADFLWDLYYLIEAKVPIKDAFETMAKISEKNTKFNQRVASNLGEGMSLASALEEAEFSHSYYIKLIDIGEKGNFLKDILLDICNLLEEQEKIKGLLKSSLIYPTVLMVFAVFTMVFTFSYVIPSVANIYQVLGIEQNMIVKLLMRIDLLYPVLGIVTALIIHTYVNVKKENYHRLLLVGELIQTFDKFLYYKMLSNLLQRGIPLYQSLEIFSSYPRKRLTPQLESIKKDLYRGTSFHKAVEEAGGESPLVINFLKISEQGEELSSGAKRCEIYYKKTLEKKLLYFSKILEPAVIAFVGVTVTIVVLTLLIPLYQLFQEM